MAKKGGKYAAITDKLPRYNGGPDSSFTDVVKALKEEALMPGPTQPDYEQQQRFNNDIMAHGSRIMRAYANTGTPDAARESVEAVMAACDALYQHADLKLIEMAQGRRHLASFAAGYVMVRRLKSQLALWTGHVNAVEEAYEQLFVDQAEVEGAMSVTLESGRGVGYHMEPYPTVEDPEAFRKWCIADGLENKLSLHPSTMTALVKQRLLDGLPEPDGVKTFSKPKLRLGGEAE